MVAIGMTKQWDTDGKGKRAMGREVWVLGGQ